MNPCKGMHVVVLVLIVGENSIGNNNYEQLAQLNSQIETKHFVATTIMNNLQN